MMTTTLSSFASICTSDASNNLLLIFINIKNLLSSIGWVKYDYDKTRYKIKEVQHFNFDSC